MASCTRGGYRHSSAYRALPRLRKIWECTKTSSLPRKLGRDSTSRTIHPPAASERFGKQRNAVRKTPPAVPPDQLFPFPEKECMGNNTNAKMPPPLRSQEHLDAVIAGI